MSNLLGLYEKAMPKSLPLEQKLLLTKKYDFDYMQLSIDEDPDRLSRLDWDRNTRKSIVDFMFAEDIRIGSLCVSANRKYPLGSPDKDTRESGISLIKKAIDLAVSLGARNILTSGYDVFEQPKTVSSREYYIENIQRCVDYAASKEVPLSIETMDDSFAGSISNILNIERNVPSPWLQIFADLGNLSAWTENKAGEEIEKGIHRITEIHFKDAKYVSRDGKGSFRNVPYGEGDVDFDGCMKVLNRLNYRGPFVIEMWATDDGKYENNIKVARDFLGQYVAKYFK